MTAGSLGALAGRGDVLDIVAALRASRGFAHKTDIAGVLARLDGALPHGHRAEDNGVVLGDDCAALPDGDGHLLFAIEGMVGDFLRTMPWFAGYSAVMVNVSDIYAMGGRPLAVVDAIWSKGVDGAGDVMRGMAAASAAYGVPLVGGHTNARSGEDQLAVAIVGRARRLLSGFAARPGQVLLMAVDLRGAFQEPYPYWNASTGAPAQRLRDDLEILPALAEAGLCDAAKDISMAGAIGTALMLLECSGAGARIDLDAVPAPSGVALERWLTAFPSYGFVLSVAAENVPAVLARFQARELACAAIGSVEAGSRVTLVHHGRAALLWDFSVEPFMMPPGVQASPLVRCAPSTPEAHSCQ